MMGASRGNISIVEYLISQKANVEKSDGHGSTALMHAAQNGHTHIVACLSPLVSNINKMNKENNTAFYIACLEGHVKTANYFFSVWREKIATSEFTKALHLKTHEGIFSPTAVFIYLLFDEYFSHLLPNMLSETEIQAFQEYVNNQKKKHIIVYKNLNKFLQADSVLEITGSYLSSIHFNIYLNKKERSLIDSYLTLLNQFEKLDSKAPLFINPLDKGELPNENDFFIIENAVDVALLKRCVRALADENQHLKEQVSDLTREMKLLKEAQPSTVSPPPAHTLKRSNSSFF